MINLHQSGSPQERVSPSAVTNVSSRSQHSPIHGGGGGGGGGIGGNGSGWREISAPERRRPTGGQSALGAKELGL